MPPDFKLYGSKSILGKSQSISSLLNLAVYETIIKSPVSEIQNKIDEILEMTELNFVRETKSGSNRVEVRSSIIALECSQHSDGNTLLTMQTGMSDLGFIRPTEVLQYGFGLSPEEIASLIIHRKAMYRLSDGKLTDPFDLF